MSSSTILFCFGTRPVFEPEEIHSAPVSVILFGPTLSSGDHMWSGSIAYSYNSATLRHDESAYNANLRWIKYNSFSLFVDAEPLEMIRAFLCKLRSKIAISNRCLVETWSSQGRKTCSRLQKSPVEHK